MQGQKSIAPHLYNRLVRDNHGIFTFDECIDIRMVAEGKAQYVLDQLHCNIQFSSSKWSEIELMSLNFNYFINSN